LRSDISRNPLNNLFFLTGPEVVNYRSPNAKIQSYFDSIYDYNRINIDSQFFREKKSKSSKSEKKKNVKGKTQEMLKLRLISPQLYPEIYMTLKSQSKLLTKAMSNSGKLKGTILQNISKAHDIGLTQDEEIINKIMRDPEYLKKKYSRLQNMETKMINNLINQNIGVAQNFFDLQKGHNAPVDLSNDDYPESSSLSAIYSQGKSNANTRSDFRISKKKMKPFTISEVTTRLTSTISQDLDFWEQS